MLEETFISRCGATLIHTKQVVEMPSIDHYTHVVNVIIALSHYQEE